MVQEGVETMDSDVRSERSVSGVPVVPRQSQAKYFISRAANPDDEPEFIE